MRYFQQPEEILWEVDVGHSQRGTVLITVVMMVALAALIATDIGYRQKMDIKRTSALLSRDQAFYYLLGAEEIANWALSNDLKNDNSRNDPVIKDTLFEDWANENEGFPVAGGMIKGKITDLQARFNINSLFASDAQIQTEQRSRLQSLLAGLGIPSDDSSTVSAPILVERIVDWIDQDQDQSGFDGREDLDYLNLLPPYRAGNQLIWDVSELLLIEGFTPDDVKTLSPHIAFLPPEVAINLNTAEDKVLALINGLDSIMLLEERKPENPKDEGGFDKVEDLFAAVYKAVPAASGGDNESDADPTDSGLGAAGNSGPGTPIGNFSVHSEYFLLEAKAIINQKPVLMEAILYRPTIEAGSPNSNIKIKTISRKLVDPLKRV